MTISIKAHRGGQVPEPNEHGHLRLGAEVDWLIEGDEHELVEIEDALPRECRERYGRALVLRFGNAVGSFDAGPLGRLSVYSGKWGEADFDRMLADITQRMSLLPFAAGSGASLPYDRSIATDQRVLYHAFVYLRHILSATAPTDDQLQPALRVVLARPHRALQRMFHWTPLEQVRRVDPRSLLGVAAPRARLAHSPRTEGVALARALNGHLPQSMEESRAETTIDLAENQFVKAFLDQALGIVDAMRVVVTRGDKSFARRISIDCELMTRELGVFRQHAMWREVSEMRRLPGESQVLQRRRGYKEVFRHFIRLRLACRLPFRDSAQMLEIKDIAELYEMWCFFQVQMRVSQALGQQPIQAESEQVNHLGARLGWGLRVAWAGGLELFYNLSFSNSAKAKVAKRPSYSLRLRPDIVLRIPHGPNAGDHIFDAKFKVIRLGTATHDDETDDASDDERLEAEERRGTFQNADIYKMHTYRDALPSARSVWILYPGSEFCFFDLEHGPIAHAGQLKVAPNGVGAVALQPGVDGALGVVVERLVCSAS